MIKFTVQTTGLTGVVTFMSIEYSTFEAKTKFSDMIKLVRSGKTVTISDRGRPVAEIRPVSERQLSNDERLEELRKRGAYIPAKSTLSAFNSSVRRFGAVMRFLENRN